MCMRCLSPSADDDDFVALQMSSVWIDSKYLNFKLPTTHTHYCIGKGAFIVIVAAAVVVDVVALLLPFYSVCDCVRCRSRRRGGRHCGCSRRCFLLCMVPFTKSGCCCWCCFCCWCSYIFVLLAYILLIRLYICMCVFDCIVHINLARIIYCKDQNTPYKGVT